MFEAALYFVNTVLRFFITASFEFAAVLRGIKFSGARVEVATAGGRIVFPGPGIVDPLVDRGIEFPCFRIQYAFLLWLNGIR